ncbi:MAG: hypothetical protein WB812_00390 [Woeseiaceae bacterium]
MKVMRRIQDDGLGIDRDPQRGKSLRFGGVRGQWQCECQQARQHEGSDSGGHLHLLVRLRGVPGPRQLARR